MISHHERRAVQGQGIKALDIFSNRSYLWLCTGASQIAKVIPEVMFFENVFELTLLVLCGNEHGRHGFVLSYYSHPVPSSETDSNGCLLGERRSPKCL